MFFVPLLDDYLIFDNNENGWRLNILIIIIAEIWREIY